MNPSEYVPCCIKCNKELGVCFEHDNAAVFPNVSGGVAFRSSGQYGSTVWDCAGRGIESDIQIVVCDDCLKENSKDIQTIKITKRAVTKAIYGTLAEELEKREANYD